MDVENVASKGVANTALGLGIGSLGLMVLDAIGGVGGLLGARNLEEGEKPITRHEMELYTKISTLESQKYTDAAMNGINSQIAQQATWNAVAMSNISVLKNQTELLMGMTKLGIPAGNIINPAPTTEVTGGATSNG